MLDIDVSFENTFNSNVRGPLGFYFLESCPLLTSEAIR